jgi:hypothetical protein
MESRPRIRQPLPPRKLQRHHHRQPKLSRQLSLRSRHRNHLRLLGTVPTSNKPPSFRTSSTSATGPSTPACAGITTNYCSIKTPSARVFAVAHYFPKANLMVHFSYDRIFQTPSFENILLSSSPQVQSFEPTVLRLPVQPSHGNYFESAPAKAFSDQFRFDANRFPPRRQQLRRRRPDFQHQHQLSPSPSKKPSSTAPKASSNSRTGSASPASSANPTSSATPGSRHRRSLLGVSKTCIVNLRQHLSPAKRPFPRLAGPAPQPSRTPSLPGEAALLDRRRNSI